MRWLMLVLALLTFSVHAEVRDPQAYFFMPKLGDFQEELATAREEGKQGVLIMFEMEDCPFCYRMKHTILNRSEVQDWYRMHFLIYSMDVKGDAPITDFQGRATTEKAFALENRARATPVFLFFDPEGRPIVRFTGAAESEAEFMQLGHYVVEGAYKSMPFNVYKRQNRVK
jgi:thioredoxin-related protein